MLIQKWQITLKTDKTLKKKVHLIIEIFFTILLELKKCIFKGKKDLDQSVSFFLLTYYVILIMDQKLQELTNKLFEEGVVKGNQEAERIISEATQKAKEIIENANNEANKIIANAGKKSEELTKNTQSELQLASEQIVTALQQEVINLVNGKIVEEAVKPATNDVNFIQQLILTAVQNWAIKQDLLVVVSDSDKKAVEDFFASTAKQLLDKGVKIESANNIKAGFQIGPADGSYKVSFTQDDFINFFKEFIRPKVVELLYGKK